MSRQRVIQSTSRSDAAARAPVAPLEEAYREPKIFIESFGKGRDVSSMRLPQLVNGATQDIRKRHKTLLLALVLCASRSLSNDSLRGMNLAGYGLRKEL